MSTDFADRFVDALWTLEHDREVDPLVSLFGPDSTCGNDVTEREFSGPDGAREFWSDYRALFGELHSEFRNRIADEGHAALEWVTKGTMGVDGSPFSYEGVSIIEHDGEQISRFRAFFNPRDLSITVKSV